MMRGEFDSCMEKVHRAESAIETQLQLASAKFEPVEHFLDRMSKKLAREYGPSTALQRRGGCSPQP
jgi:hypothetical protein